MVGNWRNLLWGDLATLEYGKALRGYGDGVGPFRVFGTNGPIGWYWESLCGHPTVVVGRKGAYRGIHYSAEPCYVIDTAFYLEPRIEFDMRWAYYELLTHDINDMDSGSAIPSTSRESFYQLSVRVPPLREQRAIAHILGTLDDKIELNRRMNETLEAMARAIFKSWFVDFDPVRAKAEGRDPGLPKPLADLFPDRLEDSELGEIPVGWTVVALPELIDINPPRSLRKGEVAPYLDMANMPTRVHSPDAVIDRPFSSGMRFVTGDTLVARITPCLENGKTAYIDFLKDGQVGWGSTEYIVLRPKAPFPPEFAYCLARSQQFREFAIQSMTGSSGRQRVPVASLSHFLIASPPGQIAELFGQFIKPLFTRASAAVEQGRTLATLRDTLESKLISGALRLKDTKRFVLERAI
jgi:type I restriction enzyme, S subunit